MSPEAADGFRYQPAQCALRNASVWAILRQQPDGTWRIVNCLDKDTPCFSLNCAFTTSGGEWPYAIATVDPQPSK